MGGGISIENNFNGGKPPSVTKCTQVKERGEHMRDRQKDRQTKRENL